MYINLLLLLVVFTACATTSNVDNEDVNIYRRIYISHPTSSAEKVEFYAKNSCYKRPKKTIIFLHGHQEKKIGGRAYLDWGELHQWEQRGFLAVAISLPGYGGSTGESDFSGPYSQDAVEGVIDFLLNKGWTDPQSINLLGVSRGGIVAGKVAAKRAEIKKLVLISTSYDLEKTYRNTKDPSLKNIFEKQMDLTKESFSKRSLQADKIKAELLILHGKRDEKIHFSQAQEFYAERNRLKTKDTWIKLFEAGHRLPLEERQRMVEDFLGQEK